MSFFTFLKRIFNYEQFIENGITHRVEEVTAYLDANYHPEPEPEEKKKEEKKEEKSASSNQSSSRNEVRYSIVSVARDDGVRYSIGLAEESDHRTQNVDYVRLGNQLDEIMGQNRGFDVLKTVRSAPLQTFVDCLRYHIYRQGLIGPQVYRAAQIDKRLYSKIISNTHYNPSRETAIALAFATRLNLDDAKTLLSRAGYTLSETNRRDLILTYFFQNNSRNLIEINGVLDALGEAPIGRG